MLMEYFSQLKQLLFDSFNELVNTVGDYLPDLLSALALIIFGLILASLTRWLIVRLGDGLDRMVHVVGFTSVPFLRNWPIGVILGWIAYWLIILFFLTAAADVLGLPGLANWLSNIINNLPVYFLAIVVILGGIWIGNAVRNRIVLNAGAAGMRQAELLGSSLRILIITFAAITALTQLGLDVSLFERILVILVTAVVSAIALAFGLGAGPTLSNVISGRYLRKNYQVGQRISINTIDGEILELLPTGVVLDTSTGRTFVPARMFDENASVLLDNETPR